MEAAEAAEACEDTEEAVKNAGGTFWAIVTQKRRHRRNAEKNFLIIALRSFLISSILNDAGNITVRSQCEKCKVCKAEKRQMVRLPVFMSGGLYRGLHRRGSRESRKINLKKVQKGCTIIYIKFCFCRRNSDACSESMIQRSFMKTAFHTLGCKVNQYETEAMKEQFSAAGHKIVGEEEFADVYVINTCTVTNLADRKSRQYIRKMKRVNPEAVVAVTGCYAQVSPEEVSRVEGVDIVAGTGEKQNLLGYIEEFVNRKEKLKNSTVCHVRAYEELNEYQSSGIVTSMESRTRAYIKIQEGCNRFCSYCIIPFARGRVRSRELSEIAEEARQLIGKGFKEIVLTGINTALYGEDFGYGGIEPLIAKLDSLQGDFRIRLSSLEPTVINKDYVKGLLKYEKLCPHLHLSVQSGSDSVLRAMNRHYTREEYLDIVKVLQDSDPLYGITTDIIVGFPGETEEDFADSMRIIDEAGFCKVHAFKYSQRKGTKAAEMNNQVNGSIKNERSRRLIEKAEEDAGRFYRKCRGAVRRVLFEEEAGCGMLTGYTDNYVKVYVPAGNEFLNRFSEVRLLEEYKDGMKGEIANG